MSVPFRSVASWRRRQFTRHADAEAFALDFYAQCVTSHRSVCSLSGDEWVSALPGNLNLPGALVGRFAENQRPLYV